jgi:hypothetical protein
VVPAYNAAFVLDTEAGALGVLEILESVNSQLLEFRYHDELLENELTRTYAELQKPRWIRSVLRQTSDPLRTASPFRVRRCQ